MNASSSAYSFAILFAIIAVAEPFVRGDYMLSFISSIVACTFYIAAKALKARE